MNRKALFAAAALAVAAAIAAPMASQNWARALVDEAMFETDARTDSKIQEAMKSIDRAVSIFAELQPSLTNEVSGVSISGSNDCYIVSSYPPDTNIVGSVVAWDRQSESPRRYVNAPHAIEIMRYDNYTNVTARTNVFTTSTVTLETAPAYEITSVTNRTPDISYTSTPIWAPETTERRIYEYETTNGTFAVTNYVTIPAYISGYSTSATTNWVENVTVYTNTTFNYTYVTNTEETVRVNWSTNVYTKLWGTLGGVPLVQQSNLVPWALESPDGRMEFFKFLCSDAAWYEAVTVQLSTGEGE